MCKNKVVKMDMLDFLRRETPHLSSDTPPTLFEHADANEGYIPGFQTFSWSLTGGSRYEFKILLPFLDRVKLFGPSEKVKLSPCQWQVAVHLPQPSSSRV